MNFKNCIGKLEHQTKASRLGVYAAMMDLIVQFDKSTQKVPRHIRITECAKINYLMADVLHCISDAQDDISRRAEILAKGMSSLRKVELMVRMLYDRKMLKLTGYSAIILREDNTMRQMVGWRNSALKKNSDTTNTDDIKK